MEEHVERPGLSRKKKGILAAAGSLTALILIGYLCLCIFVGASQRVLPGVYAGEVSLGGMTEQEAVHTMEEWLRTGCAQAKYELHCGENTVWLDGGIAAIDAENGAAHLAYMVGREEPFLKRGAVIMSQLLGGKRTVPSSVYLSESGKEQAERALEELDQAESVLLVETVWSADGDKLTVTKGVSGVSVDRDGAMAALLAALQYSGDRKIEIPVIRTEPAAVDLRQIHTQLYAQAADAYVRRDEQGECQIVPHIVGIDFDAGQAQERFDAMNEGDTVQIPLTVTVPDMTQSKLQSTLFADVLGECSTNIGGTEARLNNVIVAAKAIDGTILMPDDVFSYNDTLGPRSTANGYLPAPAYIGGKTVDDVGGGICQDSSTLYLAVLRANLEIVERTNHMYTVGYVPDGLDATVAYNAIDFKFKNNTAHPIRVEAKVSGRTLLIRLYGTDTERVTVKMETRTLSTTPYQVTYKPDDAVAAGKTVVDTTAYTGRKVQVFRCVYDAAGKLISRTQESMNNYRHRDKVILYNPADAGRWGLMDENGKVHSTVQPKPEPKPEPEPEPVPEPTPEQDVPAVGPEPAVPEQEQPAEQPEATPDQPDEGITEEPVSDAETEGV